MSDAQRAHGGLKQGVGLASVVALGLGTAVGVAIFSVIAPATRLAGPGMLASVAIAAVPMFFIAVTYAFMGSALPTSGASYEWPRRFIHPAFGFLVAWLRIAGSVGALIVLALVLVRYASTLVPLPTKFTMLAAFTIVFGLNFFGVALAARAQTILMGLLVAFFLGFAALGARHVQAEAFTPFLPHGWGGVLAATPLLVSLFFGLEASTEVGDEVKNGRATIPLGIAISIASALTLYLLVGCVALGVLGPQRLAASDTPLLEAAQAFMGPLAPPLVVAAAIIAIGKSLNALFLIFSRTLFAMARAGALPSALARVHPHFGTPHVALIVAFACCALGLLLPMDLTALFLAVSIPTLLKYTSTCFCAAIVARNHADIYAGARFRLGRAFTLVWALIGAVAAIVVAALGWSADWRPYAALAAWGLVGALYCVGGRIVGGAANGRMPNAG